MKKNKYLENSIIKINTRFYRSRSKHCLEVLFWDLNGVERNKGFISRLEKKFKRKKKNIIIEEKPLVDSSVERYNPDFKQGLTDEQVQQRTDACLTNKTKVNTTKPYRSIFFKNIFTFFNMLWLIIAVALLSVGAYKDLLFVFVIVANTTIAIVQEIRAKVAVEKLSMVTTPQVKTIRNGKIIEIPADELLLDDIIILSSGNQISADCIIVEGKVDVNESLLTGESNSIEKGEGKELLCGSFVVSGVCHARVNKIGRDNYINSIAPEYVQVKVKPMHGGEGYVCPISLPAYQAAEKGFTKAFGKKPLAVRRGGSIPIISDFERILGIKTVLMGFGLEADAIHSPNESFSLDMFRKGIEAVVEFHMNYGK